MGLGPAMRRLADLIRAVCWRTRVALNLHLILGATTERHAPARQGARNTPLNRFERCCTPSPPAPDDGDACPRAVWRRVVMVLSHSLAPRKGIPTRAMRLSGAPFCQICAVGPKAAPAQGKARRAQTHLVRGDVPKRLGPVLLHPWRGRVLLGRACTLGRRRRGLCHACHADGQMLRRAPRPRVAARPVQPHSPCLMVRALEAYYRARKAASRAGAGALQAVPVPSGI